MGTTLKVLTILTVLSTLAMESGVIGTPISKRAEQAATARGPRRESLAQSVVSGFRSVARKWAHGLNREMAAIDCDSLAEERKAQAAVDAEYAAGRDARGSSAGTMSAAESVRSYRNAAQRWMQGE